MRLLAHRALLGTVLFLFLSSTMGGAAETDEIKIDDDGYLVLKIPLTFYKNYPQNRPNYFLLLLGEKVLTLLKPNVGWTVHPYYSHSFGDGWHLGEEGLPDKFNFQTGEGEYLLAFGIYRMRRKETVEDLFNKPDLKRILKQLGDDLSYIGEVEIVAGKVTYLEFGREPTGQSGDKTVVKETKQVDLRDWKGPPPAIPSDSEL